MKKILAHCLCLLLTLGVAAQTPPTRPQQPQPPASQDEEVLRITTALVQVDAVVLDKNDQIVPDVKLGEFEVYENGKKQDVQFMEFVGVETGRRAEGALPGGVDISVPRDLTAKDVRRVVAFVVDDLTIEHADLVRVRQTLTDFVENEMRDGDLVAIVRTVGGKGLLQQFTSDKALLRRTIATLNFSTNPYAVTNRESSGRLNSIPTPASGDTAAGGGEAGTDENSTAGMGADLSNPNTASNKLFRGLISLTTAGFVIDSMKQLPGRKTMVLFSGGVPILEPDAPGEGAALDPSLPVSLRGTGGIGSGLLQSNYTYLINQLTDKAVRSGVVINTVSPQGLRTPVADFRDTPGRGGLSDAAGASRDPGFGRGASGSLTGLTSDDLGLTTLSSVTGGLSVRNTSDLKSGMDKVLARSRGYYVLAYRPTERFDNKFRKYEIKVRRPGVRVFTHQGYIARDEREERAQRTKEQTILAASMSPLARRDIDLSPNYSLRLAPTNRAALNIDLLIDPKKLSFVEAADGKRQTSVDVVGFIYDELGKLRGGFSETLNINLKPEEYQRALSVGVPYSANTELPPGNYQMRAVVREASTGALGVSTRYLEVPDLKDGRLAVSSILLYAVAPTPGAPGAPEMLDASRRISRSRELRYAVSIFNAKRQGDAARLTSQLIISQAGSVLLREPEQPVAAAGGAAAQITKVGQLGLSKVRPGRYVLTLVVTDALADKKSQTVTRSVDFVVE